MKKAVFVVTIFATLAFLSFADNGQYCPESDFAFTVIDNGTAVEITGYVGINRVVHITDRIQGMPVTVIGDEAFAENQLTSVSIPNSVKHIGDFAFMDNQLVYLSIGNSVTHIGFAAFAENLLTSVSIPSGASVHPDAFDPQVTITRR